MSAIAGPVVLYGLITTYTHTPADAAAITRIPDVTLKHWQSRGLIVPTGESRRYRFKDLVIARVAYVMRNRSMPEGDLNRCVQALLDLPDAEIGAANAMTADAGIALVWVMGRADEARIARTWADAAELQTFATADAVLVIDVGSQAAQVRNAISAHMRR